MIDDARLVQLLQADPHPLFAVVDAAHSTSIVPWLRSSQLRHECLFSGPPAITLAHCAPYLVHVDPADMAVRAVVKALWGCNSLLFVNASAEFSALRLELKKWLRASLPDGDHGFLRFYDPRVWRRIMLHATEDQRMKAFAGGIHRYVAEFNEGQEAFVLSLRKSASILSWPLSMAPAIDLKRVSLGNASGALAREGWGNTDA